MALGKGGMKGSRVGDCPAVDTPFQMDRALVDVVHSIGLGEYLDRERFGIR